MIKFYHFWEMKIQKLMILAHKALVYLCPFWPLHGFVRACIPTPSSLGRGRVNVSKKSLREEEFRNFYLKKGVMFFFFFGRGGGVGESRTHVILK